MILVNGQQTDRLAIKDRGLQYGDGLFETIAYRNKKLEFLDEHIERLTEGCSTLNIPTPNLSELDNDLSFISQQLEEDAVIKVIITRGQGGRGYKQPDAANPSRIVSSHPFPEYPESNQHGVKVTRCKQIVSQNPSLAGLKHLNRLEQVLARSEWNDKEIAEGLMSNINDELIEGTMTNLFIVKQNTLFTPDLSLSGINGIIRKRVISLAEMLSIPVEITQITDSDLAASDEVFLTNSVIGIWPVTQIDDQQSFTYGPITKQLQKALEGLL
jgi:4-amino-4-deoxychorismate lyase